MKKIEFKDMYTPLSADTFNTMQDNFEISLKKLERKIKNVFVLNIIFWILCIALIIIL